MRAASFVVGCAAYVTQDSDSSVIIQNVLPLRYCIYKSSKLAALL